MCACFIIYLHICLYVCTCKHICIFVYMYVCTKFAKWLLVVSGAHTRCNRCCHFRNAHAPAGRCYYAHWCWRKPPADVGREQAGLGTCFCGCVDLIVSVHTYLHVSVSVSVSVLIWWRVHIHSCMCLYVCLWEDVRMYYDKCIYESLFGSWINDMIDIIASKTTILVMNKWHYWHYRCVCIYQFTGV